MAAGVGAVEGVGAWAWAEEKALTPVENEILTDTAAVTNRKYNKSVNIG